MTIAAADRYALAKAALTRIAHPVAIVGAAHDGQRSCGTGTCMYVSLDPAMLAIAEHPGSRTAKLIAASREFSISLLHAAQQDWAMAAGKSAEGPDKFAALKIATVEPPSGLHAPGVAGSLAVLWCTVVNELETGDHRLFIGRLVAHRAEDAKFDALLRYRRRYFHIGHWTSDEAPEGYPT